VSLVFSSLKDINLHIAYDVIGIPRDGVAVPQTNVQQDSNMLRGSRFKMEFWEGGEGESTHFNFAWYTKKSKGCYSKYHLRWLARHVGSHLGDGGSITGCSEHLSNGELFRAHPSYRGGDCWHDWAMFQWEDDDGGLFDAPGHIIMFVHIDIINEPIIFDGDRFYIDEPGLYCMVECFDDPFAELTMKGIIVEERTKQVRVNVPGWGAPQRVSDKCLYLVPITSISGPVAAVPNVGGPPDSFIMVRPYETWSDGFTSYLNKEL
jgi:hypothetical protein